MSQLLGRLPHIASLISYSAATKAAPKCLKEKNPVRSVRIIAPDPRVLDTWIVRISSSTAMTCPVNSFRSDVMDTFVPISGNDRASDSSVGTSLPTSVWIPGVGALG